MFHEEKQIDEESVDRCSWEERKIIENLPLHRKISKLKDDCILLHQTQRPIFFG